MSVLGDIHDHLMPIGREVRIIEESVRFGKRILSDHITRQTCEDVKQVDGLAGPFETFEARDQLVDNGLNAGFKPDEGRFGKVMGEDVSADAMELMTFGGQMSGPQSKHLHGPAILHAPLLLGWIHLVNHLRIINMYLVGIDADNGA